MGARAQGPLAECGKREWGLSRVCLSLDPRHPLTSHLHSRRPFVTFLPHSQTHITMMRAIVFALLALFLVREAAGRDSGLPKHAAA